MTMTIRRHRDGTYSITGMTRTDVNNLAHGMYSAAAGLLTMPAWKLDNDHDYIARTSAMYERLARALDAIQYRYDSPPPPPRLDINSETYDPTLTPYERAQR